MRLIGITLAVVLLTGCNYAPEETANEKLGDQALVGFVRGGVLIDANSKETALDSYEVDVSEFEGKRVRVVGQYSGDTLFVDDIYLVR